MEGGKGREGEEMRRDQDKDRGREGGREGERKRREVKRHGGIATPRTAMEAAAAAAGGVRLPSLPSSSLPHRQRHGKC